MLAWPELKVLVVDDEQAICELVKMGLTRAGYSVFTAKTAVSVFEVMRAESCRVIFIDRQLSEIDGYTLCNRILVQYPWAVAYLLTGYLPEAEEAKWQEAGFAGVFIKPTSMNILSQAVQSALQAR